MKRGFSFIEVLVVIVIISIISSAGYLVWQNQSGPTPTPTPSKTTQPAITPTPNPTTNWSTYTDNSLGISFKYPSSVSVFIDQYFNGGTLTAKINTSTSVIFYKEQTHLSLTNYMSLQENISNSFIIQNNSYSSKNYSFGDGLGNHSDFNNLEEITIVDAENLYVAIYTRDSRTIDDNGNIIEQIIPTTEDLYLARQIIESISLR